MKYLGFLNKLLVMVLTVFLAGCLTTPIAQADNTVAAGQGHPLKFKKNFRDRLPVGVGGGGALDLITKKSTLTKQQAASSTVCTKGGTHD